MVNKEVLSGFLTPDSSVLAKLNGELAKAEEVSTAVNKEVAALSPGRQAELASLLTAKFKELNLTYGPPGLPQEISRTGIAVELVPGVFYDQFSLAATAALRQAFNHVLPKMYQEIPFVRELLSITPEELNKLRELSQGSDQPVAYFGFDLVGDYGSSSKGGLKINDVNTDRAMIAGYQGEIIVAFSPVVDQIEALKKAGLVFHNFSPAFANELLGNLKDGVPNIACLTLPESDPYLRSGHTNFVNYLNTFLAGRGVAVLASPEDLSFEQGQLLVQTVGGKVPTGVVYKGLKSKDILGDPERFAPLLEALKKGMPMVNSLESYLTGSKIGLFLLAWSPDLANFVKANLHPDPETAEMMYKVLQRLFPPGAICYKGTVYTQDGELPASTYLLEHDRKELVIKAGFSFGGKDIWWGGHLKEWEWQILSGLLTGNYSESETIANAKGKGWEKVVDSAKKKPAAWAIQPFLGAERVNAYIVDEGKLVPKTLNTLHRLYHLAQGEGIFQEMFGGESWKVNASGYSFPSGVIRVAV